MLKSKLMLFTVMAVGALVCTSFATANAQTFPNPTAQRTEEARRSGPCRDPWITIAIFFLNGGTQKIAGIGGFGECNPALYNGGSWSNYNELEHAVEKTKSALNSAGVGYQMTSLPGGNAEIKLLDRGAVVDKIQVNNGANVISNDGNSLVASGGGNYTVQSTATEKKINLGKSVLIIKKK